MKTYCKVLIVFVALPVLNSALFETESKNDDKDNDDFLDDLVCVLPGYPKNGVYSINNDTNARPRQTFSTVTLRYSCRSGYKLNGSSTVSCDFGSWHEYFPQCVPKPRCSLVQHDSVSYFCLDKNSTSQNNGNVCGEVVEDGTKVQPKCREPVYHYPGVIKNMHCQDGKWDHIIVCSARNTTCSLPAFPKGGYFSVVDNPNFRKKAEILHLNYFCNAGSKLVGSQSLTCINGWWTAQPPKCISQCPLNKHSSVQYLCLPKSASTQDGTKECEEMVEEGTVVQSVCRENYYHSGFFANMHCNNGEWDIVNFCSPQCGLITPEGEQMVLGGRSAKRGELPWHVGIYIKTTNPYKQICGGSIISRTVVISAAHCFWSQQLWGKQKQLPTSNYAVAVGKLYRPWNNLCDENAQKSDVRDIKIPVRFQGAATNFQHDIAIVIVQTAFEFRVDVRPICIDFEATFSQRQLHVGAMGKLAGWGLTSENGDEAKTLQVVELPYVEFDTCIAGSSPAFHQYITGDKICAGAINGTSMFIFN